MSVDHLERELLRDLLRLAGWLAVWLLPVVGILFAGFILFDGLIYQASRTGSLALYAAAGIAGTAGLVLLVVGRRLARIEKRQKEQRKMLEEILLRLNDRD